ncbi:MAG: hypothetical protein ACI4EK_01645 [Wujia sp.]
MKAWKEKTGKLNNQGSTMVEVLVGFTILVMVIVECMVHIVGVSANMVEKSADMQKNISKLNEEMYKTNADYQKLDGVTMTLKLDQTKTAAENTADEISMELAHAQLCFFDCVEANLGSFIVRYKE